MSWFFAIMIPAWVAVLVWGLITGLRQRRKAHDEYRHSPGDEA